MGIWALLIAAATGIFSSFFGISAPASMARYDKDETPYRQEYDRSYFEDGFQSNATSAGAPFNPRDIQIDEPEPTDDTAARIELEDRRILTDVSKDLETQQNKDSADALTVLSGD